MQSVSSDGVYDAIDDEKTQERSNYYGCLRRGTSINVDGYHAGIICALQQGVGCGIFAFSTGGNANAFATLDFLSGTNISSYITRNNGVVSINNGIMAILDF